jgi:transcription elongation GreA/GreB family factor
MLINKKIGDTLIVKRDKEDISYEIMGIEYP